MKNLNVLTKAQQRLRAVAAPTIVTSLNLKQADDLGSLFDNAEVEFKSPDGAIKGVIVDGAVQIMVTQEDLFNGIRAINPSTEALPLAEQVDALKATLQGYDNFVEAVEDSVSNLSKTLKDATAKKIKSVAQALDIVKNAGIFVSVQTPEPEAPPAEQKQPETVKASVAGRSLGMRSLHLK